MEVRKKKILYFVQLPPPVHGVSTINEIVYRSERINRNLDKYLAEIRFANSLKDLRRFNIGKLITFVIHLKNLSGAIIRFQPDFIYFSMMTVGSGFLRDFLFVLLIRKKGVKIIFHLHNKGIRENAGNPVMKSIYRFVFRESIVIHLSKNLLETEIGSLGGRKISMYAINNGIPDKSKKKIKTQNSCIRILFCSNLFVEKGIYELLEITSKLSKQAHNFELVIIGEFLRKKEEDSFLKRIEALGLQNFISFPGPKFGDDKWEEYARSDIFVFPSIFKQESFPLVILEAMASSLPVVVSALGAIPEIITHGVEGYLLEPGNTTEFAGYIVQLIRDPDLRDQMGNNSRKKYLGHYTLEHFENNLRNLFNKEVL